MKTLLKLTLHIINELSFRYNLYGYLNKNTISNLILKYD